VGNNDLGTVGEDVFPKGKTFHQRRAGGKNHGPGKKNTWGQIEEKEGKHQHLKEVPFEWIARSRKGENGVRRVKTAGSKKREEGAFRRGKTEKGARGRERGGGRKKKSGKFLGTIRGGTALDS